MIISLYLLLAALLRPAENQEFKPHSKLSEYGFFKDELALLKAADGVLRYQLKTELFSNYAQKERFIKLPKGKAMVYNDSVTFDFPVGTFLIKNFFYPNDIRDPLKGRRILETRLLVNTGETWQAWPYIWNEEQTEAVYDVAGQRFDVSYVDARGKSIKTSYRAPNKNECKGCHTRGGKMVPLGPTARNLNTTSAGTAGENQLHQWTTLGSLAGYDSKPPRFAMASNSHEDLDTRARAYLDVNCGSCHNRLGPASTSGLFLDWNETEPAHLGFWKSPVAAGRGSGDFSYDIEPGKPERSILLYRMKVLDPGIAMPEIGREQVDVEGVRLIEQWIKKMKK